MRASGLKPLDIRRFCAYLGHISGKFRSLFFTACKDRAMFEDIFDFGKKRTLKQSVGFFIFHSILMLGVMAGIKVFGI
jgi:hypothetical protein